MGGSAFSGFRVGEVLSMDVGRRGEADAVECPANIRPAERVRMMLANPGPAEQAAVKPTGTYIRRSMDKTSPTRIV
jgi:hypothetical protein